MKTIRMLRDYDYAATKHFVLAYKADTIVERVPEAAVAMILAAGAGEIIDAGDDIADDEPLTESPKPKKRGAKP